MGPGGRDVMSIEENTIGIVARYFESVCWILSCLAMSL